jgi:hypothetical protein
MHEGLHDVLAITVAGKRGEAMENKRGHRFKLEEYWRQANRCSGASFWGARCHGYAKRYLWSLYCGYVSYGLPSHNLYAPPGKG